MHNVKRITSHGSISIPVAIRRSLGIQARDALDVSVNDKGQIILEPHVRRCNICGSAENVHPFHGRYICRNCCQEAMRLLQGGGQNADQ